MLASHFSEVLMNRFVSIGQAAVCIGVSRSTLRRWEKAGYFNASWRTKGNHRRYDIEDIRRSFYKIDHHKMRKKVVGYARVSGRDQADDLKRRELRLKKECYKHSDDFEIISDLGSGINYNKKGLKRSKIHRSLMRRWTKYQS